MIAHSIILSAITSFALLSDSATVLAMPDSVHALQARTTSGIDVQAACESLFGPGWVPVTTGSSCNDWGCEIAFLGPGGLDFTEWCRQLYGASAYASCSGGVYNWVCNY
jgi:hypothetical protein